MPRDDIDGTIHPLRSSELPKVFGRPCNSRLLRTVSLPIIGRVTVHVRVIDAYRKVFADIEAAGAAHLIDLNDFGGTYNCRRTRYSALWSPHAYGIAIDLNVHHLQVGNREVISDGTNFRCARHQIPHSLRELNDRFFAPCGFAWGGNFRTYADPMHFEACDVTLEVMESLPSPDSTGNRPARLVVLLPGYENYAAPRLFDGQHWLTVRDVARMFGYRVADRRGLDGKLYLVPGDRQHPEVLQGIGSSSPARLVVRLPGYERHATPRFADGQHWLSVRDVARMFDYQLRDRRDIDGKLYLYRG